jgi:hypothetical protein
LWKIKNALFACQKRMFSFHQMEMPENRRGGGRSRTEGDVRLRIRTGRAKGLDCEYKKDLRLRDIGRRVRRNDEHEQK